MMWKITDKEYVMKSRFAFFPKKIGECYVWLQRYFINYDWVNNGVGSCYVPHYFIYKDNCEEYIKTKKSHDRVIDKDIHEF